MAEHVPLANPERSPKRADIFGIVFYPRRGWVGRRAALAATPLIVENELTRLGQRCQRRPEHSVTEQHAAIDREKRWLSRDRRRREDGEVDSSNADGLALEPRSSWPRPSEGQQSRICGDRSRRLAVCFVDSHVWSLRES